MKPDECKKVLEEMVQLRVGHHQEALSAAIGFLDENKRLRYWGEQAIKRCVEKDKRNKELSNSAQFRRVEAQQMEIAKLKEDVAHVKAEAEKNHLKGLDVPEKG